MDNLVYVLIGVAVLAVLYFLFGRKKADDALPEVERSDKSLPEASRPEAGRAKPLAEAKPKEGAKSAPAPKAEPKAEAKPQAKEPARAQEAKTTREPAIAAKEAQAARDAKAAEPAKPEEKAPEVGPSEPPAAPPKRAAQGAAPKRAKDVAGLRKGLAKARESEGFFGRLKALFVGRKEIDPQIVEQIEEILLTSDVGVKTTAALVDTIREDLSKGELKDEARVWDALRSKAQQILSLDGEQPQGGLQLSDTPTVVMVVGVNGVGKTTTIGKLATRLTQQGKKVVLAAGDTFRAAAVQQLIVWGKRAGCEVVTGAEGANAGAVIFDAIQKAKEIGADVVLADTAGRLHTKTNLMEELKKIAKTMNKAMAGAPHETLLVLDATNGQNATQQAALFREALPLSGIVLTKLDGTAKGGVILSICAEHKVPVRYIGVGERAEDLRDFQAEEFVEAMLGNGADAADRAA